MKKRTIYSCILLLISIVFIRSGKIPVLSECHSYCTSANIKTFETNSKIQDILIFALVQYEWHSERTGIFSISYKDDRDQQKFWNLMKFLIYFWNFGKCWKFGPFFVYCMGVTKWEGDSKEIATRWAMCQSRMLPLN
jgi:hypothetical protein